MKVISQQTKNFCKLRSFEIVMHDRIIPKVPKEKMGWSPFLKKEPVCNFLLSRRVFPISDLLHNQTRTYRIKAKTISGNLEDFFKIIGNFKRSPHHGFFVQKSTKNLICISDSRGCATPEDSDADFRSSELFFLLHILDKMGKTE